MLKLTVYVLMFTGFIAASQSRHKRQSGCSVNIADDKKRDCYPWPDPPLSQSNCEARGCVHCESTTHGVPWCFMNDAICPSKLTDAQRVDCHPGVNANKEDCNKRGCIWCSAPAGVPWCFYDNSTSQGGERCPADIPDSEKIDCHPHAGVSKSMCLNRGCFYCESQTAGVPWCFAPKTNGYEMVGSPVQTPKGFRVSLTRKKFPSWYGAEIDNIAVDVEFQEDSRLRMKIYDPNSVRYEPPVKIPSPDQKAANPLYDIQFSNAPSFNMKVKRKATGAVLFDSSMGGLTFADQFLQISTKLASTSVFGIGEHVHPTLKHDMNWKHWGMYARDQPPGGPESGNLYGVHPFITVVENDFKAYGLLVLNSNAQDVTLMPTPGLTYRTIGGILDVYLFLGQIPENVIQLYSEALGKPTMPPYWGLGFQLSRYKYNHIDKMKAAVNRMRQYDIPHDVQHGDIDYFDRNLDFTYDKVNFNDMPSYVRNLKTQGTKFITILDPCIAIGEPPGTYPPFDRGQEMDVWVKNFNGTPIEGRVWPTSNVYFPDFTKSSTLEWWTEQCVSFHQTIEFDALWIDMNEPANFETGSVNGCRNNSRNVPPYFPKINGNGELADKTLCADAVQATGSHYDLHSLYGFGHSNVSIRATQAANPGKRSFVFTRSTFPGNGRYGGRWLGDNRSAWKDLHNSIIGILEFNLFAIPYIGADICGYFDNATPELCTRWQQLGAFYTFSRNHNGAGNTEQDPGFFGADVARIVRDALHVRYTLLPYLYSLFHQSHIQGSTVIRPLHHEFTSDLNTYGVDRQFLWGAALLISPVLDQGAVSVNAYIPDARWFNYYDGKEVSVRKTNTILDAPLDTIPVHVRGGHVLPTQEPANCTMNSRNNPLGLIVALDDNSQAVGSLFWDDGESLDTYEKGLYSFTQYTVNSNQLTSTLTQSGLPMSPLKYNTTRVMGIHGQVTSVLINANTHTDFVFNSTSKLLTIYNMNIDATKSFTVKWNLSKIADFS